MLLLCAAVAFVLFGGSFSEVMYEEKCYGTSLTFPLYHTPPLFNGQLYFTPSNGGHRQLVMDKGEAKHPRLKVQIGSVQFRDLTEKDNGTFSFSNGNVLKLTIKDCAFKEVRYYGNNYFFDVPRQAEFLEFTPLHNVDKSKVLWNRTDPQTNKGDRGLIRRNDWQIKNLKQADMGHYAFRAKDNTLLSRILLEVRDRQLQYIKKVNEQFIFKYPAGPTLWSVDFIPEGGKEKQRLILDSNLLTEDEWSSLPFTERIGVVSGGFQIDHLEIIDSGTFEFRDPQGNLAQTAILLVEPGATTIVYVGIIVGSIFAVIACCCCVRKCCCKKSSSMGAESAPQTAATPAVYYHDTNQPEGPRYSAAPALDHSTHFSMNSLVSRERTTISLDPLGYNPVNIDVNPPPPEVGPLGGQGVGPTLLLSSDCLSSDPEPTFDLKGLSALPLSSGSTFCDVYTSDKLNFL